MFLRGYTEPLLISGGRGFLPLSCFDTRCLDTKSESAVSYEEFLEHGSAPREVKVSQPLRVLLRHRHTTADAILDLLVSCTCVHEKQS